MRGGVLKFYADLHAERGIEIRRSRSTHSDCIWPREPTIRIRSLHWPSGAELANLILAFMFNPFVAVDAVVGIVILTVRDFTRT